MIANSEMPTSLHLGCGKRYRHGWLNVDVSKDVDCDLRHDLEKRPWPLPDNHFAHIEMYAVLEHLSDTLATLGELHRILAPGGTVHTHVPYVCSVWAFQDPTHKTYFTERTFDYVKDGFDYNFYTGVRFEILRVELTTGSNSLTARIRNLIPFRKVLRWFLWNMYDGVDCTLRKPVQ
jgi:SAM-dependent methyltransferase